MTARLTAATVDRCAITDVEMAGVPISGGELVRVSSPAPARPDRAFRGREQVRTNWTAIFSGAPDFRGDLIAPAARGLGLDGVALGWHRRRRQPTAMAGVIVMGIRGGSIAWRRLDVEPVEQSGAGIDAAVSKMAGNA